jgi:hypothetical protein
LARLRHPSLRLGRPLVSKTMVDGLKDSGCIDSRTGRFYGRFLIAMEETNSAEKVNIIEENQ